MTPSIIKPLRPTGPWICLGQPGGALPEYESVLWLHREHRLSVISAVEVVTDPGQPSKGPEYHVSVAKQGVGRRPERASTAECSWALAQFGLDGSEEDNHVPHGVVRNFWRTVAEPLIGLECACKETEPAIIEDKGEFVWRHVP